MLVCSQGSNLQRAAWQTTAAILKQPGQGSSIAWLQEMIGYLSSFSKTGPAFGKLEWELEGINYQKM